MVPMASRYFNPPPTGQPPDPARPADGQNPQSDPADRELGGPEPTNAAEVVRAGRREVRELGEQIAREREHLARIRESLASSRLTLANNDEQIARQRRELTGEIAQLEVTVADLNRRRGELELTLGQRQAALDREVLALEQRREQLAGEVDRGLAALKARAQRQEAEMKARRDAVEQSARELAARTEAEAAQRAEQSKRDVMELLTRARRAHEQATRQSDGLVTTARAEAEELTASAQADAARLRSTAQAEADRARQAALADVEPLKEAARAEAQRIRASVETDVAQLREIIQAQARQIIESAKMEAARTTSDADRRLAEAKSEVARLSDEAVRRVSAATDEAAALKSAAATEAAQVRARADAEAKAVSAAAREQAQRVTAHADAAAQRVTSQAEAAAAKATGEARGTAQRLTAEADAAAAKATEEARDLADRVVREANGEAAATRAALALEGERRQRELAEQVAAAESARAAAEADVAVRRESLRKELAIVGGRLAAVEAAEKSLAAEEQSMSQRRAEMAREAGEFAARLQVVTDGENRLATARAEFESKADAVQAELVRRQAELTASSAALEELEGELARGRAELDQSLSALAGDRQTMQRQRADLDSEMARRRKAVADTEQEIATLRATALDQQRQAQDRAEQALARLTDLEGEARKLAADQEACRVMRAEAERLAHDLEARGEVLRQTERQVLTGWEEVRLAKSAITSTQDRLERERRELEATLRPNAALVSAPAEMQPLPVWRRVDWPVYRRWAAVVAVCTGVALLAAEAAVVGAVRPVYRAAMRMDADITRPAGQRSDAPASGLVLGELEAFVRGSHWGRAERSPDRLAGQAWRVEVLRLGDDPLRVSLKASAEASTAKAATERVDRLANEYCEWRDNLLRSVRGDKSVEEYLLARDAARSERDLRVQAQTSLIEELATKGELARADMAKPAENLRAILGSLLTKRRADLATEESAAVADGKALAAESLANAGLAARAASLDPDAPAATGRQKSPAELTREVDLVNRRIDLTRREIARLQRQRDDNRRSLESNQGERDRYRTERETELKAAGTEWTQAADALTAILRNRDTRTSDEAIQKAVARFETAQLNYGRALQAVDEDRNPFLRTVSRKIAGLTDDLTEKDRVIADNHATLKRFAELADVKNRLAESSIRLAVGRTRFDERQQRILQQRGGCVELAGDIDVFERRVAQTADARARLADLETRLDAAGQIAVAQVKLRMDEPIIEFSRNPRPMWMLAAALIVLLVGAAAGLASLLLLARPGRCGDPSPPTSDETIGVASGSSPSAAG